MSQTHSYHAFHNRVNAAAFFSATELSNIVAIWRSVAEGALTQLSSRRLQCQPLCVCAACNYGFWLFHISSSEMCNSHSMSTSVF
jgi:hypothetical protein